METAILALVLLALSLVLAGVGLAGIAERLPRNRYLGLRTPTIRDSDEAWRVGHRAGGGALIAAAGPPLLLAAALLARPPAALADWFLGYALVGVVTGGLIALASRRAAGAMSDADRDALPPRETP